MAGAPAKITAYHSTETKLLLGTRDVEEVEGEMSLQKKAAKALPGQSAAVTA